MLSERAKEPNVGITLRCEAHGEPLRSASDVSPVHLEPPRHPQDWERLHARNVHLFCGACAQAVTTHGFAAWLDRQAARAGGSRRRDRST